MLCIGTQEFCSPDSKKVEVRNARILQSGRQKSGNPVSKILAVRKAEREIEKLSRRKGLKMFIKYITKMFLYLIIAVMTLICWFIKIPMMLGNILLYFLSIVFLILDLSIKTLSGVIVFRIIYEIIWTSMAINILLWVCDIINLLVKNFKVPVVLAEKGEKK